MPNCKAFYRVSTFEMKPTCNTYSTICGRICSCWQITVSLPLVLALEVKFHPWPLIKRQLTPFSFGITATGCPMHELRHMKWGKPKCSWQKFFFTTYFLKVPFGIQRCKSFLAVVLQSICMQEFKGKRSICWKYWPLRSIKATTFSLMQKISGETVFLSEGLMPPSSIRQKFLQEKVTLL